MEIPPDLVATLECEDLKFILSIKFFDKNLLFEIKIKNEDKINAIKPINIL